MRFPTASTQRSRWLRSAWRSDGSIPHRDCCSIPIEVYSMQQLHTGKNLKNWALSRACPGKGEPHDNAVAENFFSCFKCELVYLRSYATRSQAQNSVFRYIEGFYNPMRPHSSIGWMSPMAYEQKLKRQNAA